VAQATTVPRPRARSHPAQDVAEDLAGRRVDLDLVVARRIGTMSGLSSEISAERAASRSTPASCRSTPISTSPASTVWILPIASIVAPRTRCSVASW
jgi:hypothetical protein